MLLDSFYERVTLKLRIFVVEHREAATGHIHLGNRDVQLLNIEIDIVDLVYSVVRLDYLPLSSILILKPCNKEIFCPLSTYFRVIYLGHTLCMIGLYNKSIGPSNRQIVDSVDVIGAINGCFGVKCIIKKLIIIVIKDCDSRDVSDLSVHRRVVELHLKS